MHTKGSFRAEASVGCFGSEASSFVEAIVCCGGCVALLEEVPTKHGCVSSAAKIRPRGTAVWKRAAVCMRLPQVSW